MIILDGKSMGDRASLHDELRKKLNLPDYYGNNLDALSDCLDEMCERQLVVVERSADFLAENGDYGARMLRVFADHEMQVLLD